MKSALVVGSSLIDLFLKPEEEHITVAGRQVLLTLGDKIPTQIDKLSLGGNGANVSVGLARLGVTTSFYTWLGSDILSSEIENTIKKEGVKLLGEDTRGKNTGLSVIVNFGKDRVIFSHHETANHKFSFKPEENPDIVYLTSIGETWEEAYLKVLELTQNSNIPLSFSPGSKQIENINDVFMQVLSKTTLLFVNKQEADTILKHSGKESGDIKSVLANLALLGPKIISVTDGANGAFAKGADGTTYSVPAVPNQDTINKAGAGDAYATGFLAAYLSGQNVQAGMNWGAQNAASVMTKVGAQDGLLTLGEMEKTLNNSVSREQN